MRTKKDFLFNELDEAKKIMAGGFENGKIDYGKMYLVAKYMKDKNNYGALRLEKELTDFCISADKEFNPITQRGYIKKWVNSAMGYSLREITEIYISKKDVEFLKTIPIEKDRKVLFATLIIAKALKISGTRRKKKEYEKSDRYYIKYNNLSDIARISAIPKITEIDVADLFHKYLEHFNVYPPEKELLGVRFIDKEDNKDIRITNFDDVTGDYNFLFKDYVGIGICETCGEKFERTSPRQKYCTPCSEDRRRERSRQYKREERKK